MQPPRLLSRSGHCGRKHNPHLRFYLGTFACLILIVNLAWVGHATAENLSLLDLRERIETNGWSWEADDTFINSLTPEERANLRGFVPPPDYEKILAERLKVFPVNKDEFPSYWDWRNMEGVTSVKNQGSCGSCWAFAATAELESFVKIYYGQDMDLSEQQAVSCNTYGAGCSGGWAGAAYSVFYDHGAVHQHCMPYLAQDPPGAPCLEDGNPGYGWVTGWYSIANDIDQIKAALMIGPVCTGIDASSEFENYSSGCYDVPGGAWTNHLVLIVGWDDRVCDGNGAWIIKNSWGPGFGEYGFAYVQYGAALVGSGVTQLEYTPPPSIIEVTEPLGSQDLMSDETTTISWMSFGEPVSSVDIWFDALGYCFDQLVASDVPNTGSFEWLVPNEATTTGVVLVHPHTGTQYGYGFTDDPLTVIGHKLRYVSAAGSNTPPYESPATAAHTINDAVLACTGRDTVLIAGGDYLETITISSTVMLVGGYSADFSERDLQQFETKLRGVTGTLRFYNTAGDLCGVEGITFQDCVGAFYSTPENGFHGAAIYSLGASPTIRNCVFRDNKAAPANDDGLGGAILFCGGSPTLTQCRFEGNKASHGGAIALLADAVATFTDNIFTANTCSDSVAGYTGGALYMVDAQLSSTRDTFQFNGGTAEGGAIYLSQSSLAASELSLLSNRTLGTGGAVFADESDLVWDNVLIRDNQASVNGGGLYSTGGTLHLRNLNVDGNLAANMGGGVMIMGVNGGCLENSLVTGNSAGMMAGGVFATCSQPYAVRNNLVTDNSGGGLVCVGEVMTADYNNVWANNGDDYGSGTPGLHDLSTDPLCVDPNNGDHGLGLHSPCLDRGDPDPACADPDGSPADISQVGGPFGQTEAPAAVAGGTVLDIGGGEYSMSWTANSETDVAQYVVYRDTTTVFTPGPGKVVATVTHPTTSCTDTPPYPCYYLVVAVDETGHVGGYSQRLDTSPTTPVLESDIPTQVAVARVVPNPFNPRTTIWFDVPQRGMISLHVYDLRGRLISELISGQMEPGQHRVTWNGTDVGGHAVAAGVYVIRLEAGDQQATHKVVLAK